MRLKIWLSVDYWLSNIPFSFIFILTLLALPARTLAYTEVSGEISGSWELSGSPYIVTDTLIIPQGETLRIKPGVEVLVPNNINEYYPRLIPIVVRGELLAIGTKDDSIKFLADYHRFYGLKTDSVNIGTKIHLEYCEMNNSLVNIESNFCQNIIKNCNMYAYKYHIHGYSNRGNELEFNHFYSLSDSSYQPDVLIWNSLAQNKCHNNFGPHMRLHMDGLNETVEYNTVNRLSIESSNCEIRYNNVGMKIGLSFGSYFVHNNEFTDFENAYGHISGLRCASIIIENQKFKRFNNAFVSNIEIRNSQIINNSIDDERYVAVFEDTQISFEDNLVVSSGGGLDLDFATPAQIKGNTFFINGRALNIRGSVPNNLFLRDNIFIGNNSSNTAIHTIFQYNQISIDYNCFYNIGISNEDYNIGENNIFNNPQLSTNEFSFNADDFHLSASSPCIDAGSPGSPEDPDGTFADIGAFYYDHNEDNPPTIISPDIVYTTANSYFEYTVEAVDDSDVFEFGFENLPNGIEVLDEELDWHSGTASIGGIVADDIHQFTFLAHVEDLSGQVDTQTVTVNVENYELLQGEITGRLSLESSPYLVVQDVNIPDTDTLIVDPGVTVLFRLIDEQRRRLKFEVNGVLLAEGNETDSIFFLPVNYNYNYYQGSWAGIFLNKTSSPDTSRFKYINVRNSQYGISSDSTNFILENSTFFNNFYSTLIGNNSNTLIKNCDYFSTPPFEPRHYIDAGNGSNNIIDSCSFIFPENMGSPYALNCSGSSRGVIQNSHIKGGWNIVTGGHVFQHNIIEKLLQDIYSNGTRAHVRNNIFYDISRVLFANTDSCYFYNNIIMNSSEGLKVYDSATDIFINNNIFTNIEYLRFFDPEDTNYTNHENIQYNCFFNNDIVSLIEAEDETNICQDAQFADDTFYLLSTSPLINAGNPDLFYNDVDGSRNDIGLYGGPYGESYEYPTNPLSSIDNNSKSRTLPTEFKLHNPFPNPFNSILKISFDIAESTDVCFEVYNITGQLLFTKDLGILSQGQYQAIQDFNGYASGSYIVTIKTSTGFCDKKLVKLIK